MNRARGKLAEIYFGRGSYKDASQFYRVLKDHPMVSKCFDRLFEQDDSNAQIREDRGDYLTEIGLLERGIECYHEAMAIHCREPEDQKG